MKSITAFCVIVLMSCNTATQFPTLHEFSIASDSFTGKVIFKNLTSTKGFKILLQNQTGEIADEAVFKFVPYRFDTADVDHDGRAEIIVGLIKSTRFDPMEKKRLFILRIDDGHVRPMWLGSKVCQELVDFKALSHGKIQTLERTATGRFSIGNYYWQSFGLTLDKYTHNEIPLNHASQLFPD